MGEISAIFNSRQFIFRVLLCNVLWNPRLFSDVACAPFVPYDENSNPSIKAKQTNVKSRAGNHREVFSLDFDLVVQFSSKKSK